MGITFILSTFSMWWIKVPYFPFGEPDVRGWLVLRAMFGFVGLFTLYCKSMTPVEPNRDTKSLLILPKIPCTTSLWPRPQSSASSSPS